MAHPSPLAQVAYFASLGEEQLQELTASCRTRTFKKGQVLFYENDPGSALYLLQLGQVKIVQMTSDGGEQILYIHGPGDYLGELSLVDGAPRSAGAVALDQVEALVLYREEFLALLQRHPAVALAVMSGLAGMARRLTEQLQDLTSLDVAGRIAKKLLELAERHGQATDEGLRIPLSLTQQELAEMIGATRVAVNQALGWYRSNGVLSTDRDGITIHEPVKLRGRIY